MDKFLCITKTWRDKVNGNTYFSCQVYDNNYNVVIKLPFQYGYGNQSEYEVLQTVKVWFSNMAGKKPKVIFEKIEGCTKKEVVSWGSPEYVNESWLEKEVKQ